MVNPSAESLPDPKRLARWMGLYSAAAYDALLHEAGFAESTPSALTAGEKQLIAQTCLRTGQLPKSAALFVDAGFEHSRDMSPNASVCFANARAIFERQGLRNAAQWIGFKSLLLPRECGLPGAVLQALFSNQVAAGNARLAAYVLSAGSQFAETRTTCLQTLLDMASQPDRYPPLLEESSQQDEKELTDPMISIVVCSVDDARFAAFETECKQAFASSAFELIRISDACSMCEGYNRGMAKATGSVIVFCHDDVEFHSANVRQALLRDLSSVDVVTGIGASAVSGAAWFGAGDASLQGWMTMPHGGASQIVGIVGVPDEQRSLVVGDGFFLAARAEVARAVGWDEDVFRHFHLYDMDFCLRASQQGFKIGAASHLGLCHKSMAAYSEIWLQDAALFLRKHGLADVGVARPGWVTTVVPDRRASTAVMAHLSSLRLRCWRKALLSHLTNLAPAAFVEAPAICNAVDREQSQRNPS